MNNQIAELINRKVLRSFKPEGILEIINTKGRHLMEFTRDIKKRSQEGIEILEKWEAYFEKLGVPYVIVEKSTSRTPILILMKERRT